MATREFVYQVINAERDYQAERWGEKAQDLGNFIVYMDEYMDKVKKAFAGRPGNEAALGMIRKVTALGVAAMEQHGAIVRHKENF